MTSEIKHYVEETVGQLDLEVSDVISEVEDDIKEELESIRASQQRFETLTEQVILDLIKRVSCLESQLLDAAALPDRR
jgi:chemotaxis regulatin CheY-phosphate phosphatase CheZ